MQGDNREVDEVFYDHQYENGHVTVGYHYAEGKDEPTTGDVIWLWIEGYLPNEERGDYKAIDAWLGIEFAYPHEDGEYVRFGCKAYVDAGKPEILEMNGYSDQIDDEVRATQEVQMWSDTPDGKHPLLLEGVDQPISFMTEESEHLATYDGDQLVIGCGGWAHMHEFHTVNEFVSYTVSNRFFDHETQTQLFTNSESFEMFVPEPDYDMSFEAAKDEIWRQVQHEEKHWENGFWEMHGGANFMTVSAIALSSAASMLM